MDEEINLLDYWRVLMKRKWTVAFIVMVVSVSTVIYTLTITKTYKAEATIMPIGGQKGGGLASLAAASMGLGGLLGGGGASSTSAQLLAILNSRTLAEKIIEKYDLMKIFYPVKVDDPLKMPTMEDAVKILKSTIVSSEDKKTQLIMLTVIDKDPEFAAKLVNDYINETGSFLNEGAFTAAKRNRIFIEAQLERNKAELLESGKELTTFYATNRISNVVPTVDVDVSMGGRGEDPSPEALQQQVEELKTKIEQTKVVRDVPQQVYLQYLTLRRELLGQVNSLLTQQYEMAKIDESKEDLNFQVIDWARVPVRKFKPKRSQIVMTAFVMSLFLAVFYAFFREYLQKMKEVEGAKSGAR